MVINKDEASELTEKLLRTLGRIVLKKNISVTKSSKGWKVVAETTPMTSGEPREKVDFTIDGTTGRVSAWGIKPIP